jgi:hypothetical protein
VQALRLEIILDAVIVEVVQVVQSGRREVLEVQVAALCRGGRKLEEETHTALGSN